MYREKEIGEMLEIGYAFNSVPEYCANSIYIHLIKTCATSCMMKSVSCELTVHVT